MNVQTGYIESAATVPIPEALARWRAEAQAGEFDTGHYRCRYFVWGRGQPLLFIHALTDQAKSFAPLMAHLTESFRCIGYELPTGDGDGARLGSIRHRDLVDDIFALLDHLQIGQACLYGASFGGTIALAALHAQPKRLLRAALQSSFARHPLAPMERLVLNFARWFPGRVGNLPFWSSRQERFDRPMFDGAPTQAWDLKRSSATKLPTAAFAHRALMLASLDLRPMLPAISHPVLVINGERDTACHQAASAELAAGLPHADRLDFADCGHFAQYTHAPAVAEALRRFLLPPCGLTGH
jgi:pimeloyl-ACP methyl ester carboxylesterase